MLAKALRRWIGSIRLSVFLVTLLADLAVIAADAIFGLRLSQQLHTNLVTLNGLAAVFVWKDTERPSGYHAQGYVYKAETEGEV